MPKPFRKTHSALLGALIGAGVLLPLAAQAQESVLHGLGWVTARPGSTLDGRTQTQVTGNRAPAEVSASGGKVSAGAGVAGSVALISQAQANMLGLSAVDARNAQLAVLNNQVGGFIRAIGGAASANTMLISGGEARRPLADSRITIQNNQASDVDAIGAKASVMLGAGSLQLPGRAGANAVLTDETDIQRTQIANLDNRANSVASIGGAALANSLSAARSRLEDLRVTQTNNQARDVRAGGGSGSAGWGAVAQVDLTGMAGANSIAIAGSQAQGAQLLQQNNRVDGMQSTGGSALANSFSLADYQGSALRQYSATQTGNVASRVDASGGSGSLLMGALADVRMSAASLANAISVQRGSVEGATRHLVADNTATRIQAVGGAASANSIWLQDSTARQSHITVTNNTASDVGTAGGGASIGGGVVGEFQRNGRALASSLVLDSQSTLENTPVAITTNQSRNVQGSGGLAASGSALVSNGQVRNSSIALSNNRADGVRATGFSGSAGAGLLFSSEQNAVALANSLGVFGSSVDARSIALSGNTAGELSAQGGKLIANSVSVERGNGGASRLSANVAMSGNTANRISTGASEMAGPGHAFSEKSVARAATNAVVLNAGVQVDAGSPISVTGNTATQVGAIGGTALVNALAAYRDARVSGSAITLSGNTANDIGAGGGYNQAMGIGSAKNGVLVANGVYLDGGEEGGVRLSGSAATVTGNDAQRLRADGGRINANSLAINGQGSVDGAPVQLSGNRADDVRSEGSEGTAFGHAWRDRGVGNANANALQVMGSLRGGNTQITGNTASRVAAQKGGALANSVVIDAGGSTDGTPTTLAGNQAADVNTRDKRIASANSVFNEGRITGSSVTITGNRGEARASSGDAAANSLRNRQGGQVAGSNITILGNQGSVQGAGVANGIDNRGNIGGSTIAITGNRGSAQDGGIAASVINNGTVAGSQIHILGNQGSAQGSGAINSVINDGRIGASRIQIAGNSGSVRGGGLANSVHNRGAGTMTGAQIAIVGNRGNATNGGTVNSIDNQGLMTGRVTITGNQGSASSGGIANSVINRGLMTGTITIAGNNGSAAMGGVANSVINRGVISGRVTIAGNQSAAAVGMTTGAVRVTGGALVGAASVTGNVPTVANPGYTITAPSIGVINRSVTVGPAVNLLNM